MLTHEFRCGGEGKGKKGWAGTPFEGEKIPLDKAETVAEAIEAGHFESEEALFQAAYAQRFIKVGGEMLKAAKNGEADVDALIQIGNGLTYGAKKSAEERGAAARERAQNARKMSEVQKAAEADPELAAKLRSLGIGI